MWKCKHCKQNFDYSRTTEKANHSRHCDKNPNKQKSYENISKYLKQKVDDKLGVHKDFDVICDCCEKNFTVNERENKFPTKGRYFCSRNCANSVGGKAKSTKYHYDEVAHYTTVAWRYHDRKCLVCGEENVVAVHHLDENHNNNVPENLVPLCPTHHQYMHSKHKVLIQEKVKDYIKNKWG